MICRRACLLLGILTWAHAATGEVRTIVEPRLVDEMETVRLTLRAEGATRSDSPDLTPLEVDFEVLGTQTSSRISTINGRTNSLLEYQINLRPRRSGDLQDAECPTGELVVADRNSAAVHTVVIF